MTQRSTSASASATPAPAAVLNAALFDAFPDGVLFTYDQQVRYQRIGGQALARNGFHPDQALGRTPQEAFGLDGDVMEAHQSALRGSPGHAEAALGDRTYLIRTEPLRDLDGRITGGMGYATDVTEALDKKEALREAELRFRLAFEHAPIGKAIVELDGTFREVNAALCRITGYSAAELQGMTFQDITHPDDLELDLAHVAELMSGTSDCYEMEKRYLTRDGRVVWVSLSGAVVRDSHGKPAHFIAQVQNIDSRRSRHQALLESHTFNQAITAVSPDIIQVFSVTDFGDVWTSESVKNVLGWTPEQIAGMGKGLVPRLVPQTEHAHFAAAVMAAQGMDDGRVVQVRYRARHANGTFRCLSMRLTPFRRDANQQVTHLLGMSRDITDMVEIEERLEAAALHDDLTGLPNRRLVTERINQALARARETDTRMAVLFCDLDGFKRINDAHGHQAGDSVLTETARRLLQAVRADDTVGRMGGDEFVVVMEPTGDLDPVEAAEQTATRLEKALSTPIVVRGVEHTVTTSIGIALTDPQMTAEEVLRDADTAMYEAKSQGKNGHALFHDLMRSDAVERDMMERHLRRRMAREQLEVFYQPLVEPTTGKVRGVEALLRVPTDTQGRYFDTGKIIAIAEQAGLVSEIGTRVMRSACAQVAAWRTQPEHRDLKLTVNLSAKEIAKPDLYERITAVLRETGLPSTAFTMEITETVLLDAEDITVKDLQRLYEDGVGIAIDDFGTGYASLRYLAMLPITCLKVDRTFTAGLPHDTVASTLVKVTLGLADDLGLSCVVEGVETTEQAEAITAYGGNVLVQGYLYARPQPVDTALPAFVTGFAAV